MSKKRVLFVFVHDLPTPWLAAASRSEDIDAFTAVGVTAGQRQTLAKRPDVIVVGPGFPDVLAMCEQLRSVLPSDYRPAFVLDPRPDVLRLITAEPFTGHSDAAHGNGNRDVPMSPTAVTVCCHGLEIDGRKFFAAIDGRELDLTATEFRLVLTLSQQPGFVFSRKQLTNACRGENSVVLARTIDVHVRSIRKKLGDRADLIETVRGVGYRFRDCADHIVHAGRVTCPSDSNSPNKSAPSLPTQLELESGKSSPHATRRSTMRVS